MQADPRPPVPRGRFGLLLLILVLLPIDWFAPTGLLLREAGAKPLNVLLLTLLAWYWLRGEPVMQARAGLPMQTFMAGIVCCGTASFLASAFVLPPLPPSDRSPVVQFASQTAMLLLFMGGLQTLTHLFARPGWRARVLELLPAAALVHLGFYLLETVGLFSVSHPGPLALFRNDLGLIDRASGLMSEPSYYGTFAGLYAMPLLLFGGRHPVANRLLALVLLVSAFLIQAKTMFLVIGAQIAYLLVAGEKPPRVRLLLWLAIAAVIPAGLYMSLTTAAVDLEENLSSIMRLGSNALAWRVASEGYGLIGVGTGQFHFLYLPQFAPDFLMLSQEALDQMSGVSGGRASTYNLPLRLLVETGVLGLLLFAGLVLAAVRHTRRSADPATLTGMCFVAGSLGFLMTQDSYSLPALAFGLALALTETTAPCGLEPR